MQRRAAREIEDAVAVGEEVAGEEVVAGSLAVPLRQCAAGDVRLDGQAGEELVDLDVVGQLGCVAMLAAIGCCQPSFERSMSRWSATISAPASSRIQ